MAEKAVQLIKGAGDIGSAVAHGFRMAGLRPVVLESPATVVSRRRMAFGAALHQPEAMLEGLRAVACTDMEAVLACLEGADCVPVLAAPDWQTPAALAAAVVVAIDARMRKKESPPVQIGEAPLVVGIGPGFVAGRHAHAVVESNWGPGLGRVLWEGAPEEYTGRHREVEGFGAERYIYAPHAGRFATSHAILAPVRAGEVVGRVDDTPLAVTIGGVLRGLAYDGTPVAQGAKLVEVEPRGDPALCIGIAERPRRIAEGVIEAVRKNMAELFAG
ncbi:MAG: hypothetical protein V3S29_11795 [bacterium]